MSYTFQDYENSINNSRGSNQERVKVGFFKLGEGEEALVRFNVKSVEDLHFVTLHKAVFGKKFEGLSNPYAGINCLNELGGNTDSCPFCRANAGGHAIIDKGAKKVFVEMMVSYKDKTTGTWSQAVPAVWERPAGFGRELATKLESYGDLTQTLLKMTRTGNGKDTRYSLDYAVPTIFKPEMVPVDFSAFDNFDFSKHSYYKKSTEEMTEFAMTGKFPEVQKPETVQQTTTPAYTAPAQSYEANTAPVSQVQQQPVYTAPVQQTAPQEPVASQMTAPAQAQAQPAAEARPTRTFTNFSF